MLFSYGCSEQAREKAKQSSHRDLKSPRKCLVKQWEYLDSETEMWWCWAREVFDYILFPACCRRGFVLVSERAGLLRLPGLGLHFWGILPACWGILVQYFLPVDLLAGIAVLRACARLCGCRCLSLRGGCNQMLIRLRCLCISGATFVSRLSLCYPSSSLWLDILASLIAEVLGGLLVPSLAKGKIVLSIQLSSGQAPSFYRSQLLSALSVQKAGFFILPSGGCPG